MAQISFIKGKSVTLTLVLNNEYDPTNIEDIVVKLRKEVVAQLTTNTLLTTSNPRVFRVALSSEFTNSLNSISKLQISLDDTSLGVFQFELIDVYANASLGFSNTSVNNGSDFTLNLTINPESTVVDIETVTIYNAIGRTELDGKEDFLGNPSANGLVLSSTTSGVRSWISPSGASSAVWGSITGTIGNQTDLVSELSLKANINNPTFTGAVGGITKSMVGLGSVDNTSDINKPISTATQDALYLKANFSLISNINNTSDLDKPISTATQSALNLKANIESPIFTGTVSGITKAMVGLSNIDNTSDINKPISTVTQSALDLKSNIDSPIFTGTVGGITKTMVGLGNVPNTDATNPVNIVQTSSYRFITDTEKTTWNGKENALGNPDTDGKILSSTITGVRSWIAPPSGGTWGSITGTLSSQNDLNTALDARGTLAGTQTWSGVNTFSSTSSVSSGISTFFNIKPTITQTGTAGYTVFLINTTETTIGSGTKNLFDLQVGGVSKFSVTNDGFVSSNGKKSLYNNGHLYLYSGGGDITFSNTYGGSIVAQMKNSGNFLLGTTTDTGEKLQVNGTSKFTGAMNLTYGLYGGTGNGLQFRAENGSTIAGRTVGQGLNFAWGGDLVDIPSAVFQITSTTKGFLPPRMTTAQKNAIASPAEGLMVYQTDGTKGWYGYNGTSWVILN